MPSKTKTNPLFAVCLFIAAGCAGLAVLGAFQASDCQVPDSTGISNSNACSVNNQLNMDASIAFALVGVVFAVGAVGFQIGHLKSPAAPPPVPFPMAGGPPYPGPVPPPHQGPVPPQGPPPPPPVRG